MDCYHSYYFHLQNVHLKYDYLQFVEFENIDCNIDITKHLFQNIIVHEIQFLALEMLFHWLC